MLAVTIICPAIVNAQSAPLQPVEIAIKSDLGEDIKLAISDRFTTPIEELELHYTVRVSDYVLAFWQHVHTAGVVFLQWSDLFEEWEVVGGGGGVPDVNDAIDLGVPTDVAPVLIGAMDEYLRKYDLEATSEQ
ncbi:hypothetical protein KR51_00021590 [Rubidibacter lacunae KORDI 51-2]|uniref:Uncharacterized protein n=1 Tax=Rubidibacter lacunae KORDI 51-2 TaxID=582515 RepID=U5DL25_9CHRO|nr:hypothetical protein KR51_00021590 [Rubidibacter lacunae KORDI 51-2]